VDRLKVELRVLGEVVVDRQVANVLGAIPPRYHRGQ
jgi:hypothetical protein